MFHCLRANLRVVLSIHIPIGRFATDHFKFWVGGSLFVVLNSQLYYGYGNKLFRILEERRKQRRLRKEQEKEKRDRETKETEKIEKVDERQGAMKLGAMTSRLLRQHEWLERTLRDATRPKIVRVKRRIDSNVEDGETGKECGNGKERRQSKGEAEEIEESIILPPAKHIVLFQHM